MKIYAFRHNGGLLAWQAVNFNNKNQYDGCPIFFAPLSGLWEPASLKYMSFAHLILCPEKWIDDWRKPYSNCGSEEKNPLENTEAVFLFETEDFEVYPSYD